MNHEAISRIPGLLAGHALSRGPEAAIVSAHGTLSYEELHRQARQFAAGLRRIGVSPGTTVGLMCTNRPEWIVAALGTILAGGRVAAFNTWAKRWDLEHLLAESGCEVLIALSGFKTGRTDPLLQELVPEAWEARQRGWKSAAFHRLREIVLINGSEPAPGLLSFPDLLIPEADNAQSLDQEPQNGDDPILVLYTSGSTARPKAVPIHHSTALVHGQAIAERMAVTADDRIWVPVPLFWSYGGANALMVGLTAGATLVLQEVFEPVEALAIIEKEQCTVAYTLPNITAALVQHEEFSLERVRSLTKGMTIGSSKDVETAAVGLGITGICNAYGSTELYGGCTVTPWDWDLEKKMASQGPPLRGNTVVIRDHFSSEDMPVGEVGEITVRGYVTSGYLGAPEQNQAAFTDDGAFRTGDLGFFDEEGFLHLVGRASEMIRTGGINIAPVEVEEFLRTHPAVGEVAVVGVPDDLKGEVAVAFVTLAPDADMIDEAALKAYCRSRIASFKIPARMAISREGLPRTDTGKLARKTVKSLAKEYMASAAQRTGGIGSKSIT
ncbi:class I adenylate-forming enzyme family protein [Arthrobacter sp. V1I7]|uniref:class I adenylate-forming enzyme family protein n=1 Tax=Arthrobacter sp. V1I7 TaxID=3042274 RepID=UPI0027D78313|nr:class I adenylate-forming enzyme family protein [Arthrobacter sp. V1I7]